MARYSESELWKDVVPIPQTEGGPHPLAAINYSEEYSEAMSYLRALMAQNEHSDRTLELTDHIISMNPAHYTVWLYRAETIKQLAKDPMTEIAWLDDISMGNLKNYQIWHHRQTIMSMISKLPASERPFLARVLDRDVKNYHVWSYRQWLVSHFSLWPVYSPGLGLEAKRYLTDSELEFVEGLLQNDVRNNSAWNHRFFCLFGSPQPSTPTAPSSTSSIPDTCLDTALFALEIDFAQGKIRQAPQNASAWNYMRGVAARPGAGGMNVLESFASEFVNVDDDTVQSKWALDLLAELWSTKGETEKAHWALERLSSRYDPVRRNYWNYRRDLLAATSS